MPQTTVSFLSGGADGTTPPEAVGPGGPPVPVPPPNPLFTSINPNVGSPSSVQSQPCTVSGEHFLAGGRTVVSARMVDGSLNNFVATMSIVTDTTMNCLVLTGEFQNRWPNSADEYRLYVTFSDVGEIDTGLYIYVM